MVTPRFCATSKITPRAWPHQDGCAGMVVVRVQLFYRADGRFILVEETGQFCFEFEQSRGEIGLGVQANDARIDQRGGGESEINHPVAGDL